MDTTSRIFYSCVIVVIAGLVVSSDAVNGPYFAIVATIMFVLGGGLVILLLNPFAKMPVDDHDRKIYQIQREHEAQLKLRVECNQAERESWKKQLAQERGKNAATLRFGVKPKVTISNSADEAKNRPTGRLFYGVILPSKTIDYGGACRSLHGGSPQTQS